MKRILVFASFVVFVAGATPVRAQLGGILKAKETADKVRDIKMSDADERKLGEQVSQKIRGTFGVYQDAGVTKYVTLVGTILAQASSRPNLNWEFIVLDTDAVNAYAAPGGLVHITRGLLGLVKNEAELADVLGHEITHVTAKHTVRAIQKSKAVSLTADQAGGGSLAGDVIARLAEAAYNNLIENKFDRDDEMEADRAGIQVANKIGYSAAALSDVLKRLEDRNKGATASNGLFASHPDTQARLEGIAKTIKDQKLTASATVAGRYKEHITWDAKPAGAIATANVVGTKALTEGSSAKSDDKGKNGEKKDADAEPPKKKGGGILGKINLGGGSQSQSSQTTASAGGRAIGPDNNGKGGDNPRVVAVKLTPAEIEAFKKGITG
jgi:predicted Zn-dependent protease